MLTHSVPSARLDSVCMNMSPQTDLMKCRQCYPQFTHEEPDRGQTIGQELKLKIKS